jgi:hypothetical protein
MVTVIGLRELGKPLYEILKTYGYNVRSIAEFIAEVHEILHDRLVFYLDYIGGHCSIPNTGLLGSELHQVASSMVFQTGVSS